MKISILTASIGGIDEIKGIPRQTIPTEYRPYFDNNLPFPLPNLNNRLKSKYVKIQSHRFLDSHIFIWVDGRVEITADVFTEEIVKHLGDNDVAIFRHPERETAYNEIDFMIDKITEGNNYLLSRYGNQALEEERDFYFNYLSARSPLYACTVFARKNNPQTNEAFNEWWRRCIEFSYFDQTMFSYACKDLKIKELDRKDFKNQFKIGNHVKNI